MAADRKGQPQANPRHVEMNPLQALKHENDGLKRMIGVLAPLPVWMQESVLRTLASHYDDVLSRGRHG